MARHRHFFGEGELLRKHRCYHMLLGGDVAAIGRAPLPEHGIFVVGLEFEVARSQAPVEVRTFIAAGAIEGEFELVDVTMAQRDK